MFDKKEYDKNYYKTHKETSLKKYRSKNSEKRREYNKNYYNAHKEKAIKYAREWEQKNPEIIKKSKTKWRENNRVSCCNSCHGWVKAKI
jgi:hypothetical protein